MTFIKNNSKYVCIACKILVLKDVHDANPNLKSGEKIPFEMTTMICMFVSNVNGGGKAIVSISFLSVWGGEDSKSIGKMIETNENSF